MIYTLDINHRGDFMGSNSIDVAFNSAFQTLFIGFVSFIPDLMAATAIMILGVIVSGWAKWLIGKAINAFKLETMIKGSPVDEFFKRAQLGVNASETIASTVRWLVLILFGITAINVIGLTQVSNFLSNILSYIPKVFASIIILILGTLIAGVVESLIKGSVSQISYSTSRLVSRIGSYIVMIFTILAAIAQLGIAESLINTLFIGFVATLAIGFGLAFGLGAKDLVAKILDEWYSSLKKEHQ